MAAALLLQGCAIHYRNTRTGTEHLWGLGQLQLDTQSIANLSSVTTGSRVPGLCLEISRWQFGVSLGYVIRQQTILVDPAEASSLQAPVGRLALPVGTRSDGHGLWAIGHLRLKSVPSSGHSAVVTGRALAGLGVHAGREETSLTVGADSRQRTVLAGNAWLDFTQEAPRWPGFELFGATFHGVALPEVASHLSATNSNLLNP